MWVGADVHSLHEVKHPSCRREGRTRATFLSWCFLVAYHCSFLQERLYLCSLYHYLWTLVRIFSRWVWMLKGQISTMNTLCQLLSLKTSDRPSWRGLGPDTVSDTEFIFPCNWSQATSSLDSWQVHYSRATECLFTSTIANDLSHLLSIDLCSVTGQCTGFISCRLEQEEYTDLVRSCYMTSERGQEQLTDVLCRRAFDPAFNLLTTAILSSLRSALSCTCDPLLTCMILQFCITELLGHGTVQIGFRWSI